MRRIANLLACAAIVFWLTTAGTLKAPGQAAKRVEAKAAPMLMKAAPPAAEDFALQIEQAYGAQIRQLCKTEMHFVRQVCQPTRQQYEKIAADGEVATKAAIRTLATAMRGGVVASGDSEWSDPRMTIANAIAKSVGTSLPSNQAEKYQKELDERISGFRRVMVLHLVAAMDDCLHLSPEQRQKLSVILENNWDNSWNQPQWLSLTGQYFPRMPDDKITPILTDAQRAIWQSYGGNRNIHFGFGVGVVQGVEIEDETWDGAERAPKKDEGKAVANDKAAFKAGEKQ